MDSRNHHMFSSFSTYLVRSLAGLRAAPSGNHAEIGRRSSGGYAEIELRPSGSYALSGATATLELPNGDARLSWVPAPHMAHSRTVHLPLGALLSACTVCGYRWVRSGGLQLDKVAEGPHTVHLPSTFLVPS